MATFTYSSNLGMTIADSAIQIQSVFVYGTQGTITDVSVNLIGLTHAWAEDLDMLLVGPDGTSNIEFLSDARFDDNFNGNYIFSDTGSVLSDIGTNVDIVPGDYAPSVYGDNEDDAYYGASTGNINHGGSFNTIFGGQSANGNWELYVGDDLGGDTGSLTSWGVTVETSAAFAQISGTAGADSIVVTSTNSTNGSWNFNGNIVSYTGVSVFALSGFGGSDTITGGDGDDFIEGGADGDFLNGGANGANGDTLSYASSNLGVNVSLFANSASTNGAGTSHATGDSISNFENLTGSIFSDFLQGDLSANILTGGSGADILDGLGGLDQFFGGVGNDIIRLASLDSFVGGGTLILDGGDDYDTLELTSVGTVDVDLGNHEIIDLEKILIKDNTNGIIESLTITGSQALGLQEIERVAYASDVSITVIANAVLWDFDISGLVFTGFNQPNDTITIVGNSFGNVLVGSMLNDTVSGFAGNDTLDGGIGDDALDGGSGNDRIIYDAADNAANVTGGADIDTLVVIGGAVPLSYNLVAGSFEFAEHQYGDVGSEFWDTIADTYNQSWQQVAQDGVADDGRYWHTDYDVADAFWYATISHWYNSGDQLQYVNYTRTDGSYIIENRDFDNSQWWNTFSNHYNTSGQNFLTEGNADDGRYWVASFDVAETEWWSYYTLWFDTADANTRQLINVEGIVDDGRSWTTTYDVDDLYTWSEQTVWYDTNGDIDFIVTV